MQAQPPLAPGRTAPVDLKTAIHTISGKWSLMVIVLLCVIRRPVIAKNFRVTAAGTGNLRFF
jgi:hypothetical protein